MEIKVKKIISNAPTAEKKGTGAYSKTWLAALANKGTGKILDMRAVLK